MTENPNPGGLPTTGKKYTPTFKAEHMRQAAAGARQTAATRPAAIAHPTKLNTT